MFDFSLCGLLQHNKANLSPRNCFYTAKWFYIILLGGNVIDGGLSAVFGICGATSLTTFSNS